MYRIKPYELNISDMSRHEDFDFILPIPLINYREASNPVDSVIGYQLSKKSAISPVNFECQAEISGAYGIYRKLGDSVAMW